MSKAIKIWVAINPFNKTDSKVSFTEPTYEFEYDFCNEAGEESNEAVPWKEYVMFKVDELGE